MNKVSRVLWLGLVLLALTAGACTRARATSTVPEVGAAPEFQATAAAQPGAATISLVPDKTTINAGDTFKVDIKVSGVSDLYAADVRLQFDSAKLEVVDANPGVPGTQIEVGKFLDPSAGQGFVAQNSADNAAGRISYAVTLLSPAKPVQGEGSIATVTFKAKEAGAPTISFLNALLTKQDNSTISAQSRPLGAAPAAQPTAATKATSAPAAQPTAAPKATGGASGAATTVTVDPATATVAVNGTTQVAVKVNNVTNMFGADVRIAFDPAILEVVDDDAAQQGVQVKAGDCFPAGSQTARNSADNVQGAITFASSRVAPATPVTGSCTVITVTFKGKANGSSQVGFSRDPQLADTNGQPIAATRTGGNITVGTGGGGQPGATATATRVPPTAAPPTPTATGGPRPTPTATPAPGGGGASCTYTVRAGDTLAAIALRYGTTWRKIADANGLSNPDLLRIGQTLTIPNCTGPVQPPQPGGGTCITYIVKPGDTLIAIARAYGTSPAAIVQANGLSNPHLIRVGQRLLVCPGPGGAPPPPPPPSGQTYVVKPGDTLSAIALRFGTTVYDLTRANGLANPNLIYPGMVLRVP